MGIMSRRHRIRRIAKWAGLLVCVLMVVAWVVNLRWIAYCMSGSGIVGCAHGAVVIHIQEMYDPVGWRVFEKGGDGIAWRHHLSRFERSNRHSSLRIPLWMPLVVVAIPTAILWRRDRRRILDGHCQKCGYDLTANVSGKCPECGTACDVQAGEAR